LGFSECYKNVPTCDVQPEFELVLLCSKPFS